MDLAKTAPSAGSGHLVYCRRAMGVSKILVLLVSLSVVACLLVVPVLPEKETAHAGLETTTVDNTGRLLGENSPRLNPPDEAPSDPSNIDPEAANVSSAMKITVPRLGLEDVAVPTGSGQAELDKQGIMHVRGSGLPWMAGSNTFIAGHALGFPYTRVPYAFYKLDKMKPGDEIFIEDKEGQRYTFMVYDTMTVEPGDYWVTYPVEGETVVSLQSCTPIPTFEHRLIVRAQLVS
jgi:sortase A